MRERDDTDREYKLEELAHKADVSPRTVRYYVQRGLLPAPVFRGRDTAYSGEHLLRLRAIKKLQEQFLPLDAIQAELQRRTPREIIDAPEAKPAGAASVEPREPPPPSLPLPTPHPYRFPGRTQQPYWHEDHSPIKQRERLLRIPLLPGVELTMTEAAERDPATRALVDMIEAMTKRPSGGQKDGK
ncbi:MAG: MerR family transcriptional regulator [Deltaproteobacteria bacterium]|nr:MerR family transcriptional regulator [Deltaproteobacteria bacterium]